MNLTQPPFDDIHVRKAMNWIIDKAALRQAWGGPIPGSIANHIVPTGVLQQRLAEYDPYATPNESRQRREGAGGDEGLEVRHRPRRQVHAPARARTCC